MGVSGELRYLGPDFSSVERVRPVKAMTLPASLEMGNMTRLRNLEYMASPGGSPGASPESRVLSPEAGRSKFAVFSGLGTRDSGLGASFQENRPLSRRTSSLNSPFRRSRNKKPESGA